MMSKKIIFFCIILLGLSGFYCIGEELLEELTDVRIVDDSANASRIILDTTGEIKFHVFKVTNPSRLVIEMVDAVHNWSGKEIEVNNNLITRIRSGQYKDEPVKIVRVVLDMAADDYSVDQVWTDDQITISISLNGEDIKKSEAVSVREREYSAPAGYYPLEPNQPTEEHNKKISAILEEKEMRNREKNRRKKEISKIKKGMSDVAEKEEKSDDSMLGNSAGELVDFNFKDADIIEVLQGFALKIDKNIITASGVSGKVNLRLKNVPFRDAFYIVLERSDLVAVRKSANIIEVYSKSKIPMERLTFQLSRRNATEMKMTLDSLMTTLEKANTTIAIDQASNSIIASGTSEILGKIGLLVKQLDIKSPQIKIKARIIEVTADSSVNTGVTWASSIGLTGNVQEVRAVKDMGNYSIDSTAGTITTLNTLSNFSEGGVIDVSAVINQTTLYGVLNFLSSNSKAKTISEPTILTENNKTAKIHVGQNLPIQTTSVTETGTTQSVVFIPEGIDLQVTPVVSPGSNQVSMQISVSVSEFVRFQNDNPVTSDRSAITEVTVESGKTIIIGGLMTESVTVSSSGIPILKDLPLLGYLFSNKSNIKERKELLIFLSPEIMAE
ncbi:MAG: AMIN domain-containing protein [Elusimicrobiota bacterium]